MEILELKAKKRSETGSSACRRLREKGSIPGVIYGHQKETVPVVVQEDALEAALRARARTLDLALDGARERVVFKEVQHDPLGERILHVDFGRISEHEIITIEVELRLQGVPRGVKEGGVLDQRMQEVEIECPADAIPERITVRVDDLGLEETLRLHEIPFPEGARPTKDPETVVVTVRKPEEEEVPAEPAEAMKEPEVITAREKKEEEEA